MPSMLIMLASVSQINVMPSSVVGPFIINLAHRTDRWIKIKNQSDILQLNPHRVDAVYIENDESTGCLMSHINALEMGADSEIAIWICEDDCKFLVDRNTLDIHITKFLESSAEVLCLGFSDNKQSYYDSMFLRTYDCQAASCYIVKKSLQPKLLELWKSVLQCRLDKTTHPLEVVYKSLEIHNPEFLRRDQSWKILQQDHIFLIPIIRCAVQDESYSDIEHKIVNYGV